MSLRLLLSSNTCNTQGRALNTLLNFGKTLAVRAGYEGFHRQSMVFIDFSFQAELKELKKMAN